MKTIQILLLAVVAMIIATSCTVEHTVNFNENMSGSNEMSIDMTGMINTLSMLMPDSAQKSTSELLGDMDLEKEMAELKKELENNEGLSNFEALNNVDKNTFGFKFDFEDVKYIGEGMDAANKEKKDKSNKSSGLFVLGKNKLTVDFGSSDISEAMKGEEDEAGLMGFDMGNYVFTINFPFEIKNVDNKSYLISEDRKSVSLDIPIEEITKNAKSMNVEIAW